MRKMANLVYIAFMALAGLYLLVLGAYLSYLGGSFYYLLSGAVMLATAWYFGRGNVRAVRLFGIWLAITLCWSLYEADGAFLSLLPRLAMWLVLGLWFFLPLAVQGDASKAGHKLLVRRWIGIPAADSAVCLVVAALPGYEHFSEGSVRAPASSGLPVGDWRHYGSHVGGTRFAELDQINTATVGKLREVWRYRTGVNRDFKGTPLQVDGKLLFCTARNIVIAIDADSGAELWRFDPDVVPPGDHQYAVTCRGIAYHEVPDSVEQCAQRVVVGTVDSRLIALDAKTGRPCEHFGDGGTVDVTVGLGEHHPSQYYLTSPALVAGDLLVIGGLVMDSQRLGLPSGAVRAYSAQTGEFVWAWDMGRPDDGRLPVGGEAFTRGTPNVWSMMSFDPELGLIYVPTGNAGPDYFGGERREIDDKWGSSIVALDVKGGQPVWSFQTVHHDVWDYDVPAQPTLVDVEKDGELVPAVAVATKRGEIFLLNRRNGEPVHPIEERPVPQDGAEGERLAPTQPFSSLPHFRPFLHEKDMWGLTPLDQLMCRVEYRMLRYEGLFTPPTTKGSLQFPGNFGGFNWGGISVDADNGLLIAAPMLLAMRTMLVTPERVAEAGPMAAKLLGNYHPAVNWKGEKPQATDRGYTPHDLEGEFDYKKIKYYGLTGPFMSRFALPFIGGTRVPCFEPPWSKLAVIDLNTNELLWSRPLGTMNESGPFALKSGLPFEVGVPLRAGTVTTRGGLIFSSSTMDRTVRAFNTRTGELLWQQRLPGNGQATPMTYLSSDTGRQYLIVTVPNPSWTYPRDAESGTYTDSRSQVDDEGGYVIAYALDEE